MTMKFTVANWHTRPVAFWLAQFHAYTIMVSPPRWSCDAERNRALFAATASEVFGNITPEEYTTRFSEIMRARLNAVRHFIARHDGWHVILLCACPDGQFCHRHLVAKLLKWLGCEEVPLPVEESEPMEDIVVTVPKTFGLDTWIDEGDPAGEAWSGEEWHFYLGDARPNVQPGARVYVLYNGILRGYSPLVRVEWVPERACYALVRHGGAVAVTIDERVPGFRGFRARWWKREDEKPFDYPWYDGRPAWQVPMEWERVPWHPKPEQTPIRPVPGNATHTMALGLDGIPIAGYYKHAGVWHCTRCDETFPNAGSVQDHIKGNEDHIRRAVSYYQEFMARKGAA